MKNYITQRTANVTPAEPITETTYEVREAPPAADPAARGIVIAIYATYREAFRHWQDLDANGRSCYVARCND